MNFTTEELTVYALLLFLLGAVISFLVTRAISVSRKDFLKVQTELNSQNVLVEMLQGDKEKIQLKLSSEEETNKYQSKQLSDLTARFEILSQNNSAEKVTNEKQQHSIEQQRSEINQLHQQLATFTANNQALLEKLEKQEEDIIAGRKAQELHFEKVANRLLEEKASKFSQTNKENIEQILNPLKDKIKTFEQKVESNNKESIDRHSSLKEMIKHYSELSQKVGAQADNLAKSLKGDFKQQGNWGEIILQSILDRSGLEKDREYFIQKTEKDDEGNNQRPDVIIELPDNKRLIIDSKVSLVAYEAAVNADEPDEAETHLKRHALAVKNHIKGLADKNYHNLYQVESPDFVMMFIPMDTAFSAALRHDPTLYDYAFSRNVIIVTASTLLATLKTVESLWKNDKQQRNALAIAAEAGKMYDKFVGFAEDMEKMGTQLGTVQRTYDSSMKKLKEGSGNLVAKAEKIKKLGANARKVLPESVRSE